MSDEKPRERPRAKRSRLCDAPNCGRPAYARGLCQSHRRQFVAGRTLEPIRPYRKRISGTVKLAGHRLSPRCARSIVREAERRGLSLSALITEILEDWYLRKDR